MSTTTLVVELLVVGSGGVSWISLIVLAVLDYTWLPEKLAFDPMLLLVVLPIMYVVGLIMDRAANLCFARWSWKIRSPHFGTKEAFQTKRVSASTKQQAWAMFEYGRSRTRVVRGWALNSVALLIAGNIFLFTRAPSSAPICQIFWLGSILMTILCAGCVASWYDLTTSEAETLAAFKDDSSVTP